MAKPVESKDVNVAVVYSDPKYKVHMLYSLCIGWCPAAWLHYYLEYGELVYTIHMVLISYILLVLYHLMNVLRRIWEIVAHTLLHIEQHNLVYQQSQFLNLGLCVHRMQDKKLNLKLSSERLAEEVAHLVNESYLAYISEQWATWNTNLLANNGFVMC